MVRVRRIIITNIQLIVPAKRVPINYWHLSQPPPQGLKCKYDISFKVTKENLGLFRKVIPCVILNNYQHSTDSTGKKSSDQLLASESATSSRPKM